MLSELVNEGDSLKEALANAQDAMAAVVELYSDAGRPLPGGIVLPDSGEMIWSDTLVEST